MIKIIPTSKAEHIARKMRNSGAFEILEVLKNRDSKRFFPDKEIYIRILNLNPDDRHIVLHSGAPEPNDGIVELEFILKRLNNCNVKNMEIFFTYFPYGKQDQEFVEGELNSAKELLEKLVDYYCVRKIYTIDAHFSERNWLNKFPATNVSAVELLKKKAEEENGRLVYISPDKGGELRTGIEGMRKKRQNSYTVDIVENVKENLMGQNVAVIDDLLQTGGTLLKAHDKCRENRAKNIVALLTHGVLPEGIARVKSRYSGFYITNTIDIEEANVDVTPLVVKTILDQALEK